MVRVKICCITTQEEAALAVGHGAAALGLVGRMPSGPGVIEDRLIARIALSVPPPVATFLLTSETEAEAIVDHARRCGTNTVQLVDAVELSVYGTIRRALPHLKIVQVIHVSGAQSVADAQARAPLVDALLLDSGRPSAAVRELGGTGRTHDWSLSREIVAAVDRPVFLVRPFGVDLCTGVRRDGRLDPGRLQSFFNALGGLAGS
jgi:phosphoribosylanthranilate isomerase